MVRATPQPQERHVDAPQTTPVFTGLVTIGEIFGRSRWTIRRWVAHENFPAAKLPNGEFATTLPLISEWLLERARKNGEKRDA